MRINLLGTIIVNLRIYNLQCNIVTMSYVGIKYNSVHYNASIGL